MDLVRRHVGAGLVKRRSEPTPLRQRQRASGQASARGLVLGDERRRSHRPASFVVIVAASASNALPTSAVILPPMTSLAIFVLASVSAPRPLALKGALLRV
jgi:hypothetical protein